MPSDACPAQGEHFISRTRRRCGMRQVPSTILARGISDHRHEGTRSRSPRARLPRSRRSAPQAQRQPTSTSTATARTHAPAPRRKTAPRSGALSTEHAVEHRNPSGPPIWKAPYQPASPGAFPASSTAPPTRRPNPRTCPHRTVQAYAAVVPMERMVCNISRYATLSTLPIVVSFVLG